MAEFSFEQDVAPYASNFFARTQSNPLLSAAKKTQLTGDLLDKLEGFKKVTDEDADRSLQTEIRRTQLDRERLALDDARLEFQKKREATELEPFVSADFERLFDGVDDPNEQQKKLAMFAMRNSDVITRSPALAAKYRFASDAITKPSITPYQQYSIARQAEMDRLNVGLKLKTEQRRTESAAARAEREEQERLGKLLDTQLVADEAEALAALREERPPKLGFKNPVDRDNYLDFLSQYGVDTTALEDASDTDVYKAGRRRYRELLHPATTTGAPPVDFNLTR
jgi:hypothetical protein